MLWPPKRGRLQLLRFWPGAAAAGGSISGRVFDASGASIAGFSVRLDLVGGSPTTALTNADGIYEFLGLADGDYYAIFDPGAGNGPVIVYNQRRSTGTADVIKVRTGDAHTGIDATFSMSSTTLSGFIQNPSGSAQGIDVSLYIASDGALTSCCSIVRSVPTNSDGFYSMVIAYGANYKVRFAGNTPQEQWWDGKNNPGNDTLSGWTAATTIFPDGEMTANATLGTGAISGAITGIAACTVGATSYIAGVVDLRSGGVTVDTRNEMAAGAFTFTGTAPNSKYTLVYFGSIASGDFAVPFHCSVDVTTDRFGNAVAGTGADPRALDLHNHSFPKALPLTNGVGQIDYMAVAGRPNWYKITIAPGQRLSVTVTGGGANAPLPVDLVLTLFGDIPVRAAADRAALAGSTDPLAAIRRNDAGVAPDGLSPDGLSPDGLSPDGLSPDGLSPDGLSPDGLSPDGLSPDGLSPDGLSPDGLSPDGLSPDGLSPDGLSDGELATLYTSAQTKSLLRVSDKAGSAPEAVAQNTWSNTGTYYVRVRGHNAAFSETQPYTVTAALASASCNNVALTSSYAPSTVLAVSTALGGFKTIILTNTNRLGTGAGPLATGAADTLRGTLNTFAARPEIGGVLVNLASGYRGRSREPAVGRDGRLEDVPGRREHRREHHQEGDRRLRRCQPEPPLRRHRRRRRGDPVPSGTRSGGPR